MFFRRAKPHEFTFEERLENLKKFGFKVEMESPGRARVTRMGYGVGCGAIVESAPENSGGGSVTIGKAGVLIGDEIGMLVNHGYQMFLSTPRGGKSRRWRRTSGRCTLLMRICARVWD
jgi:hypothetical protein